MPLPSFPTGTVSGESRRDRTFPPSDPDSSTSGDDAEETARPAPGADEASVPGSAPSDAARRDGGSSADSSNGESLRERVARLERENEALRRKVKRTQRARQNVIDHYERVIADIDDTSPASGESETTPTVRPPPVNDGLADRVARRLDVGERWR
ncbi:hypothetical protein SAMN04488063_3572 [Halopelagius inordinatus]|uniref:Transposase n=1 Tax=Halopelagius inordinatus TaxID=553467 RepID=A0A1I2WJV9_9EURY|nr:hypothetical protein [Halopelagius inordinatus]SFH00937.1 hypothetical protein SAMN04488063_3572 [Halopelagius inordinatus]